MLLAAVLTAVVMAALSLAPPQWLAVVLLLVLGAGWIIALTTLNGAAQGVLPNWVRGRGLAIYLMVFNGAMAAGSLLWGLVAQELGVAATLLVGGVGLLAAGLLFHRLRLPTGEADLQPSNHWPEPLVNTPVENDRGPVMIQVEYRIREQDRPQFLRTLLMLERARRRDGAYAWASPSTPAIRNASWSGSWWSPGRSTCGSTSGCRTPTPICSRRRCASTSGRRNRWCITSCRSTGIR